MILSGPGAAGTNVGWDHPVVMHLSSINQAMLLNTPGEH